MKRSARRGLVLALLVAAACTGWAAGEEDVVNGYKMTTYVVGFLYRGPKWTPEKTPETEKIQAGHMANIRRMGATGKLVLAGPFLDDGDLRGLFVFHIDAEGGPDAMIAEAEKMVAQDPAVQAGRLVVKFHPWYSADGIGVRQEGAH